MKTSNLSKAHVTRDSSVTATWAIVYSKQIGAIHSWNVRRSRKLQSVQTDGRTDRRTPRPWIRRTKHS